MFIVNNILKNNKNYTVLYDLIFNNLKFSI